MTKSIKIGQVYHRPNSEGLKRLKRKLRLKAKKSHKFAPTHYKVN